MNHEKSSFQAMTEEHEQFLKYLQRREDAIESYEEARMAVERHLDWVQEESEGWEGDEPWDQADLREEQLRKAVQEAWRIKEAVEEEGRTEWFGE